MEASLMASAVRAQYANSSAVPSQDLRRDREADLTVPLPTYFSIGNNPLPEQVKDRIMNSGGEVIDNLVFLGELSRMHRAAVDAVKLTGRQVIRPYHRSGS